MAEDCWSDSFAAYHRPLHPLFRARQGGRGARALTQYDLPNILFTKRIYNEAALHFLDVLEIRTASIYISALLNWARYMLGHNSRYYRFMSDMNDPGVTVLTASTPRGCFMGLFVPTPFEASAYAGMLHTFFGSKILILTY